MLEPEPTKRLRFIYSTEPDPQTSGSKSGSNQVWKVREPDRGQSTWILAHCIEVAELSRAFVLDFNCALRNDRVSNP